MIQIAQFRSKGRMPAVCWIHPHNTATLTRCSQVFIKNYNLDKIYFSLVLELLDLGAHKMKLFLKKSLNLINIVIYFI